MGTPEWRERIEALQPDLILSVYYRNMIGMKLLDLARLGAFNMHGSLLPRYRGRAPINWAVLNGEPRIGMTLHRMVKEPDAGAIVDQEGVEIGPRDTAEQAFRKVLPCARMVLARQIDRLLGGTAVETPQDESQATYFGGRKPEDGRINWAQASRQIFNLVRAVADPYPGAFTDMGSARLMVWWAEADTPATRGRRGKPGEILSLSPLVVATGDGAIEITKLEWKGGPAPSIGVGQFSGRQRNARGRPQDAPGLHRIVAWEASSFTLYGLSTVFTRHPRAFRLCFAVRNGCKIEPISIVNRL